MRFFYFLLRILFFYFLFRIIFGLIFFFLNMHRVNRQVRGHFRNKEKEDRPKDKFDNENIVDAEFEDIK